MAEATDYYAVLGISRGADADTIRKAYRKLARQHHPDANGGDEAAAEQFKRINRAYETLSNAEKRSRYDRYGADGVDGNGGAGAGAGGFSGGGFGDLFEMVFGASGGVQERGPAAGNDLRADLEVTLEEVLKGAHKTLSVHRQEHCEDCSGSGAKPGTSPQKCVVCAGQGYVRTSRNTIFGAMSQVAECYRCEGRGQIITDPCAKCRGKGVNRQIRKVTVDVPPGVEAGMRMRLSGQGDAAPHGGPAGDLYVFLHIKADRRFRVEGRDLITEVETSFARASLGGTLEIPTLAGDERLNIPAGTQPGDVLRLRGKGLPQLNRPQTRGDQNIIIKVRVPKELNEKQRQALVEFAEAGGESLEGTGPNAHHGGSIFDRVRNLFGGKDDE